MADCGVVCVYCNVFGGRLLVVLFMVVYMAQPFVYWRNEQAAYFYRDRGWRVFKGIL